MNLSQSQLSAISHLNEWKVGALFMEAGTGKTRVACQLINAVDTDFVLWIGPLRTFDAGPSSVITEIERSGGISCSSICYVGVESISQSDRIFIETLTELQRHKRVFIVVDESLKIKNAEALRTKRILELARYSEYRLVLNGTPLSKNLLDLWSQMEFLSPSILRMSLLEFKNTFCNYTTIVRQDGRRKITKEYITGYENIDYLYSLIHHYVYECDLHLNVRQNFHNVRYSLSDEDRNIYNAVKERILTEENLELKRDNIFMELTQKMQHSYCCTPDKFIQLDKLFEEIEQASTIIFCKYIDSRECCESRYPQALVLSYQKNALGLNLQDYRYTVYFDKIWDLALRVQSSRRTYRVGQLFDCQYYDFTGDVKLESLIDENISKKVSMVEYFKHLTKEQVYECL